MREWILQNIVTIFTTILGGSSLAAYFFERKKNRVNNAAVGDQPDGIYLYTNAWNKI